METEPATSSYDQLGYVTVNITVDGEKALQIQQSEKSGMDQQCQYNSIKEELKLEVRDLSSGGLSSKFSFNIEISVDAELIIECLERLQEELEQQDVENDSTDGSDDTNSPRQES